MSHAERSRIPWARAFAQGLTILASILIAFGIDAWWDAVGARQSAREQLARVAEELAAIRPALAAGIESQKRIDRSVAELRTTLAATAPRAIASAPDTLWTAVLYIPTVQPSVSASRALIETGGLRFVRDADLRDSLSVWPERVANASRNQEEGWRFVVEELTPVLRTLGDIGVPLSLLSSWFERELPASRAVTYVRVRNTPELANLLAERRLNADLAAADYADLVGRVDALSSAVQAELGAPRR